MDRKATLPSQLTLALPSSASPHTDIFSLLWVAVIWLAPPSKKSHFNQNIKNRQQKTQVSLKLYIYTTINKTNRQIYKQLRILLLFLSRKSPLQGAGEKSLADCLTSNLGTTVQFPFWLILGQWTSFTLSRG